jgi:Cof subfamily protein (haloacid dehalogenase superfamily)
VVQVFGVWAGAGGAPGEGRKNAMARPRSTLSLVLLATSLPRPKTAPSGAQAHLAAAAAPPPAARSGILGQVVKGEGGAGSLTGLPPVRLVATDLDGTLLRPDGTVSERTVCAVRAAREAGLHVIPITGRPPRITWAVAREAGLGPLGVCSNGAAVVDISSMEVIETETMAAEVATGLVTMLRELFPGAVFAVEEMDSFTHEVGFVDPSWGWDELTETVDDIVQAVSSTCIKLIMRRPGWPAGELLAELKEQVAEKGHVTSSGLDWVEIAGPGISKAYAAERVCKRLGVAVGEVLAIGDNHNDLTVLAWAGRAAAPANAIAEVLATVQTVLPPNAEDGVAQLLEELVRSNGRYT